MQLLWGRRSSNDGRQRHQVSEDVHAKVLINTLVMAGVPLREGYGMTESTPMTIMTRYLEVVSWLVRFPNPLALEARPVLMESAALLNQQLLHQP